MTETQTTTTEESYTEPLTLSEMAVSTLFEDFTDETPNEVVTDENGVYYAVVSNGDYRETINQDAVYSVGSHAEAAYRNWATEEVQQRGGNLDVDYPLVFEVED